MWKILEDICFTLLQLSLIHIYSGGYRGNWSPYVPRNLILRYSKPGDWVLDQFSGSGTTLVEAKLLNRNAVGIDINPQSVSLSEANLKFECKTQSRIFVKNGDATNLSFIKDDKIDFICTHPPYANIIQYKMCIRDRPTGALDYNTGKAILKLLQDTCREKGMTVIVLSLIHI